MKLTKSKLKQIIKEEADLLIKGFGKRTPKNIKWRLSQAAEDFDKFADAARNEEYHRISISTLEVILLHLKALEDHNMLYPDITEGYKSSHEEKAETGLDAESILLDLESLLDLNYHIFDNEEGVIINKAMDISNRKFRG